MNVEFISTIIADSQSQTQNFFSATNIISVAVATTAVSTATNALNSLFHAPLKMTAFIFALIIAYIAVAVQASHQWYDWVLAFFNACLLFCSAMGLNQLGSSNRQGFATPSNPLAFRSWLKPN
jgi:Mn2+/Fe2+ NRAMP family transporter